MSRPGDTQRLKVRTNHVTSTLLSCDSHMSHSCDPLDKSLCVSVFGDADEAKAFQSGSTSEDNSGISL